MTHTDTQRRTAFRNAIFAICGSRTPPRRRLADIGQRAAAIAGRVRPWGGAHIYVLIHFERYPKYGIHSSLYSAVMKLAGMDAFNGRTRVTVYAAHVRENAVVLLRSRKCARSGCRIHFVGLGKYCSEKCRDMRARHLRKRAAQRRRQAKLLRRRRAQRSRHAKHSRRT
jgi:hypothetical protein